MFKEDFYYTIILALYIVYMLTYFKTRYSFAHPIINFDDAYFKHPIGYSEEPTSKICRFGRDSSFLLAGFIITKYLLYHYKVINKSFYYGLSRLCFISVLILSFMNFNAVIYLIPFFIYESRFFSN